MKYLNAYILNVYFHENSHKTQSLFGVLTHIHYTISIVVYQTRQKSMGIYYFNNIKSNNNIKLNIK